MKRIRRTLLASITTVGLTAGLALAGPGFNGYSGDPNEPHVIKPTGYGKVAEQETAGSIAVSGNSKAAVSSPTSGIERNVLRAYLVLQRYFLL